MAANIYEAQSIVKRLSNEQLIESYKNGSLPQFIVFSEMKSRQDMMKTQPQMPTQTVAESMVGRPDILQEPVMERPAMAAKGGQVYSDMPNQMDNFTSLPPELRKMIGNRVPEDSYLSKLIERQTRPDRDYNLSRAESYLKDARDSTETFQEGGEVKEPRFRMSGKEFADTYLPNLIRTESNGVHIDPKTGQLLKSRAGAKGITQVMPGTGQKPGFGIEPLRSSSEEDYKIFSKDYLDKAYDIFEGDHDKTLTSYNMGIPGVQRAVARAQKEGGHWREYIPTGEATNYYGKIIGKAQSDLPPRQDMAGADTYERPTFAYDNAFLPSESTANNVGTEKDPDNRGLGAYLIKKALEMRGVPQRKKEGGPIRLQAGSEGEPVPSEVWDVTQTPADLERQANERLAEKAQGINFEDPDADRTGINWNSPEVQRVLGYKYPKPPPPYNPSSKARPRIIGDSLEPALNEQPKEKQNPPVTRIEMLYPREVSPVDFSPPEAGMPRQPEVSQADFPPPEAGNLAGPTGMPTGPTGPTGMPPKAGPNTGASSLAGQLAEIKSLMGTSLSNEAANIFARDEKILASMQNDKLINTLMAASAVLAKQRVGSVNYGEAVATAGMAAQEAQGRIVKTEREMNKTRLELAAAQDDRDFKAITSAMTRLNHLDTTNTQLQVAVYNANRAATAQEHSDERARLSNEAANIRSERTVLSNQLAARIGERKALELSPLATEQDKKRVDAEIASIDSQLTALSSRRGSAAPTPPPPPPGQTVQ